eukprot:5986484-Ditylum_brightwellii.AAC.2
MLVPMLSPIKDTSDPNHFLKPKAIRKHISDNGLAFEGLKKEPPKLKSQEEMAEEYDLDCAKDRENRKPLKGTMVCNIAVCGECKYPRCSYSQYVKGSKKYDISKEAQEQCWMALQHIKEVLSSKEVKVWQVNTGGKQPLPLCEECIEHKITAPTMGVQQTLWRIQHKRRWQRQHNMRRLPPQASGGKQG